MQYISTNVGELLPQTLSLQTFKGNMSSPNGEYKAFGSSRPLFLTAVTGQTLLVLVGPTPVVFSDCDCQEKWEIDRKNWKLNTELDWFKKQEIEPLYPFNGKSILTQWLKEVNEGIGWVCSVPLDSEQRWCDHGPFNRLDRAVAHVRKHLNLRPFRCGGECGWVEWYVSRFLSQSVVHWLNPM